MINNIIILLTIFFIFYFIYNLIDRFFYIIQFDNIKKEIYHNMEDCFTFIYSEHILPLLNSNLKMDDELDQEISKKFIKLIFTRLSKTHIKYIKKYYGLNNFFNMANMYLRESLKYKQIQDI
jgi:hypothetical protein